MEATQVNISNDSVGVGDHFIEPTAMPTSSHSNMGDLNFQDNSLHPGGVQLPPSSPGVSNCYVFKSRLQEYAQKVGIPTPVYQTIKEGPSHEPSFRSTVIVDGQRYESLPGFFNRKAAEQSAAEVALIELSKSGQKKDSIAVPVHETGLCKNLLQEYAQKMNYAIPTYICRKDDTPGRTPLFSCTVDIGGIQYIGAAARTKKEAEIKAARTALLAIRSSAASGDSEPKYLVVPAKRKMPETALLPVKTVKAKKQKKPRLKKKRNKPPCQSHAGIVGILGAPIAIQVPNHGLMHACTTSSDLDKRPLKNTLLKGEASVVKIDCGPQVATVNFDKIQQTTFNGQLDELKVPPVESSVTLADPNIIQEENSVHHIGYSMIEKSSLSGELESLPLESSEDPANHLEEEKHRPTNTV